MKRQQQSTTNSDKGASGRDLNLFAMSKEGLIKKVQILMHEMAICHRYEAQRQALGSMGNQEIRKQLVEKEIVIGHLKKNESILQNQLKDRMKEVQALQANQKQKETLVSNLQKQNQILKKQLFTLQKSKSRQYSQKIQANTRQVATKIDHLQKQNKQAKKTIAELTNKVKILNGLNQQTEQKLAEALTSRKIVNEKTQKSQPHQDKENQEPNRYGSLKIQNLSLKQQIRSLKDQIRTLQNSKESLKAKFHQKQLLYSRMLPLKP